MASRKFGGLANVNNNAFFAVDQLHGGGWA